MGQSPSLVARLASLAPTISVGILTADLMALGADLARLDGTGVALLHFDVMDGCFTPMMTFGPPLVKAVRTPLLKDVHLMIDEPLEKLGDYVAGGADVVTVHAESCTHIHRVLQRLGTMENANDPARGIVRGVALNPGTPIAVLEPLLDELDLVHLLAINPGWGGQKFLPATMGRIADVRRLLVRAGRRILLGVDGGITRENVGTLAGSGVDLVVTGSAVFDGKAPAENARTMLAALRAR
ncbi:MAG: ribulose-phosphate 3-epimerase [Deltaproteobacteria bacterium]|nr:MAG: ribulose-phosphate 3-epimerase [Deltaproteobacteria bacterium]